MLLHTGVAKAPLCNTSSTLTHDVYALIFNQKGLRAGLGIQGSKITKLSN